MIHNKDRSGWIGASDTSMVVGNWGTKTFSNWWAEKLGIQSNHFENAYTRAGTWYEGKILDHLGVDRRDRQILLPDLKLRVNLDGETHIIHEVKTHKSDLFKVTPTYWRQAQVEMFAAKKPLVIDAYRMEEADYQNYFNPIDPVRLSSHFVQYDQDWIEREYLPKLRYLADCLKRGVWP